jgi:autotransporter-associated beta strand protein
MATSTRGLCISKGGGNLQATSSTGAAALTLTSESTDPVTLKATPVSGDANKSNVELVGGGGIALISSGSTNQQTGQVNQDITISNTGVATFQQTPKVLTQNIATEQHVSNNFLVKSGPASFFGTLTLTDPPISDDPASANNHLMRKLETDTALGTKVNVDGTARLTGTKTFASPVISETAASNDNELIRKGEVDTLLLSKASTSIFTGDVEFQGDNTHSGALTISGGANFTNNIPSCGITPSSDNDLVNKSYVDTNSSGGIGLATIRTTTNNNSSNDILFRNIIIRVETNDTSMFALTSGSTNIRFGRIQTNGIDRMAGWIFLMAAGAYEITFQFTVDKEFSFIRGTGFCGFDLNGNGVSTVTDGYPVQRGAFSLGDAIDGGSGSLGKNTYSFHNSGIITHDTRLMIYLPERSNNNANEQFRVANWQAFQPTVTIKRLASVTESGTNQTLAGEQEVGSPISLATLLVATPP